MIPIGAYWLWPDSFAFFPASHFYETRFFALTNIYYSIAISECLNPRG